MWFKCSAIGLCLLLVSLLLGSCVIPQEPEGEWHDVNYQFPTPEIQPVEISTGEEEEFETFDQIWMAGFHNYGGPGEPVLPYRIARILIPQNHRFISVEITGEKIKLSDSYLIEPGQVPIPLTSNNFTYTPPNPEIYQSENPFPTSPYEVISVQDFRGYKILLVKLIPVEYIPGNGELSYFGSMEVNFETEPIEELSPLYRGTPGDEECVLAMVDNPEVLEVYPLLEEPALKALGLSSGEYDMVIITNDALKPYWNDYATWKTLNRGIATTVYTVEDIYADAKYSGNDDQDEIRNFIIDAYNTWGIEYVLLGGDVEIVPVRLLGEYPYGAYPYIKDGQLLYYTSVPSDLYYAGLNRNWDLDSDGAYGEPDEEDWFADVYVGRVPADNSTHVLNFYNKVKDYEEKALTDYHSKVLFLGGYLAEYGDGLGGTYIDDVESKEFPSSGLHISKLYDPPFTIPSTPTEVTEAINAGTHIIYHVGHGPVSRWAGFLDIYAVDSFLTNTDYFLCHSRGCWTNAFDDEFDFDALSEHFLCTAHGAFAYVGNTRSGGYWPDFPSHYGPSDHLFELEFYDAIFDEHRVRLGPILQDSKEEFAGLYQYNHYNINLLGDPSTPLRIGCELVVRDHRFDDGSLPSDNGFCPIGTSPDICVDSPSGTGYPPYSENPEDFAVNQVYVSVHNKGCLPANNVTVKLYWADPALNANWPSDWNYIGEDIIPSIPAGGLATATIDWLLHGIVIGHGCLLATVETTDDPISTHNVESDNNVAQLNWVNFTPMVAADGYHTVGLKSDGTVVAIGWNVSGQCRVSGWGNIAQVAAGVEHTVGLKFDGTVVAVGRNDSGQCNVDNWTGVHHVAAGSEAFGGHTVGVKRDGTVVAVGLNDSGQCDVDNWMDIVQVDAGYGHTVGRTNSGTVVAVGKNASGQCNVDNWTGIIQVAAGGHHTVGLECDGQVVAVGYNYYGQCNVTGWTDIIQVAAGWHHTVGLKSDGTMVAVGWNASGQCAVGNWMDIIQVAASGYHTVGLKSDGKVIAIGFCDDGQCDVADWMLK